MRKTYCIAGEAPICFAGKQATFLLKAGEPMTARQHNLSLHQVATGVVLSADRCVFAFSANYAATKGLSGLFDTGNQRRSIERIPGHGLENMPGKSW